KEITTPKKVVKTKEETKTTSEKPVTQSRPGFPPINQPNHETAPTVSDSMRNYANCLFNYIDKAPSVKQHDKMPNHELDHMIKTASKNYTYDVVREELGAYINMTNGN